MGFIKNRTPYRGKMSLHFEAYPWWTGKTKLNNIHLDLGFTKLVSRITPERDADGHWVVNSDIVRLIEQHTGGVIDTHTFEFGTLENSFMSPGGKYIGNIERGLWYYEQGFKVCDSHPLGVAEVHEDGKLVG